LDHPLWMVDYVMASSSSTSSSAATVTATGLGEATGGAQEGTLKLTLKKVKEEKKKIQWTEDTVDNEGLGKKKSKCCCQYKKPRGNLDESSSDSDSDDECGNCPGHSANSQ